MSMLQRSRFIRRAGAAGLVLAAAASLLVACGGGGGGSGGSVACTAAPAVDGPVWWLFGRDAQHAAVAAVETQPLERLVWRTAVDLAPQYTSSGALLIHYGSPLVTARNTVIVPVKTGTAGGFRVEARQGHDGCLLWSQASDYLLPPHRWVPSFNPALAPSGERLFVPTSGGRVIIRDDPDSATGTTRTVAFYGNAAYDAAPATYDANVVINTPLTVDANGTVFFGFTVLGANPAGLVGGIARIASDGTGAWVSAATAAGDAAIVKTATNSAPALSADGATLYVAVNTVGGTGLRPSGYLLALDSATLATRAAAPLLDPALGTAAWVSDDATSSPTVGPDGDVFLGVLEASVPSHNYRGWLLHFDAALGTSKTPGAFGWDTTASIVPASMVPSYTGPSSYLLATKYNNYGGAGTGDGKNRLAVLDPAQTQADAISGEPVMLEVLTMLGPTPDPNYPGGVLEWCINTMAVDPLTSSILVNNEDGKLYRWDLRTNSFTQQIALTSGLAAAYTPTAIGPDGRVYAINNATLFSVGR
ncbi:hypothetical protein [Caldimonas sp. KR1-144]|uniref:hypothetical protein n=1 Tax=Caldimonas sp. KR1-144 TaxID=3400911 RepID=UPI003C09C089